MRAVKQPFASLRLSGAVALPTLCVFKSAGGQMPVSYAGAPGCGLDDPCQVALLPVAALRGF